MVPGPFILALLDTVQFLLPTLHLLNRTSQLQRMLDAIALVEHQIHSARLSKDIIFL